MRSFGARSDTTCIDEPFYAAYLALTGVEHPMREEILTAHEPDAERVAEELHSGRCATPIQYQKHMAHHMVPEISRVWMDAVTHVFLIRHPARVIASYINKTGTVSLSAIGFPLQWELFELGEKLSGATPLVVDSDDILIEPEGTLSLLCERLGIEYEPSMLSWAPGSKPEDGVWGKHWYDSVWKSSGFGAAPGELPVVPEVWTPVLNAALSYYERFASLALKPSQLR